MSQRVPLDTHGSVAETTVHPPKATSPASTATTSQPRHVIPHSLGHLRKPVFAPIDDLIDPLARDAAGLGKF